MNQPNQNLALENEQLKQQIAELEQIIIKLVKN